MPADLNVTSHFKGIAIALLGVIAAALGIYSVGAFKDYFESNPYHVTTMFSSSLGIDILGAVLPVSVALTCGVLVFALKLPAKKLLLAFLATWGLAFYLCHPTDNGVAAAPLLFALIASAIITALTIYPKPFANAKRNFVASLLLTLLCVPLSLFLVDLSYVPQFSGSVIGGVGLSDGILIAALYTPLSVTAAFSALAYMSQMAMLLRKNGAATTLTSETGIQSDASEEKSSQKPSLQ